jgi:hypothetical protein
MKRRGYRNLLALADEAERQITAARRLLPSRDYIGAALTPPAKAATKAARQVQKAERHLARAECLARESARSAYAAADTVGAGWISATPATPAGPRFADTIARTATATIPRPVRTRPLIPATTRRNMPGG